MQKSIYFISHPNVEISASVPVPDWPLSKLGRQRMQTSLTLPWIKQLSAIYCSTEQKAIDGAEILSTHLGLTAHRVQSLGENDRSSTGFLKPEEFERTADEFFKFPEKSVRGWETAQAAQGRIVDAVNHINKSHSEAGDLAIVSHGAVGTLLYCHFTNTPIDRRWDQPNNGGGNYLKLTLQPIVKCDWWTPID